MSYRIDMCNATGYWQKRLWGRSNGSWATFINQWTPLITMIVRGRLMDGNKHLKNDLEDAIQCVWIRIFVGLSTCRRTNLPCWIKTTADRTALNYIRDNENLRKFAPLPHPAEDEAGPAPNHPEDNCFVARGMDGYSKVQHDELWARVNQLPAAIRDTVLLHVHGYSEEEIAAKLEVEPATARKRLSRARASLRDRLGPAGVGHRMSGHRKG